MDEPFEQVEYLPCLNDHPDFVNLIADIVCDYLGKPASTQAATEKETVEV
jgi:hypothetical protein